MWSTPQRNFASFSALFLQIGVKLFMKLHFDSTMALKIRYIPKIQQTKMLVTCQRFGHLLLFGLVWQYSSVWTKYNKGRFKDMATYLQQ
jgi:hypothetical protein